MGNTFEELANEIRQFLIDRHMWLDTRIYFNGMCYCGKQGVIENIDPLEYFEYVRPGTLSMSFEGDLYETLHDGEIDGWRTCNGLDKIIKKFGYHWEFGNDWNLHLFKPPSYSTIVP